VALSGDNVSLLGNVFAENTDLQGVASLRATNNVVLENNVFFRNVAAVRINEGNLTLRNNTFFDNTATATRPAAISFAASVNLDAITHNAFGAALGPDCGSEALIPQVAIAGHNLFQDFSCLFAGGEQVVDLGFSSVATDLPGAPLPIPLPFADSPVIDAGAPAAFQQDPAACTESDVVGAARANDSNGDLLLACTIGAYEGGPFAMRPEELVFADGFEPLPPE
jgi:hypothetical protein